MNSRLPPINLNSSAIRNEDNAPLIQDSQRLMSQSQRSQPSLIPLTVEDIVQLQKSSIDSLNIPILAEQTNAAKLNLKGETIVHNRAPRRINIDLQFKDPLAEVNTVENILDTLVKTNTQNKYYE